ncbi:penicillin-binding protein activator [Asaia sp. W19]|uniref:penicillin-binding protein activator n=1 Tax=unclassified Asaia TaxID=2685023 RepID=UPI000F8D5CD4|nr:penicillin-binding protein activator [Asaia sp. W19]RUT26574.1 penicillin-binding protein activator [Asaia sp. W19]
MVGRTFGPRQRVISFTSLRSASACKVSALAGVALFALNACNGPETAPPVSPVGPTAQETGTRKIGMLLPLTGRFGKLGQQMANAAHIAVPDGHGVTLDIRDTDAPGQTAESAARAAIDQGDRVILGPLTAPQTASVAALTQAASLPEFAYTSDQAQARPGVWVMGVTVEQQVDRLVDAATGEGRKTLAAFLPDNALGHALGDALLKACTNKGLTPPQIVFHTGASDSIISGLKTLAAVQTRQDQAGQQSASVSGPAQPASTAPAEPDAINPLGADTAAPGKTAPPSGAPAQAPSIPVAPVSLPPPPFDALLLGDTGLQLATVIDGLKQASVDPHQTRILGPALWSAFAGKLGALQGGWFAAPDPSSRTDFVQRYRSRYGYAPSVLANVAYDTATMAAVLSQQPDGFSQHSLLRPDGFAGADGTFVLQADGTVARGLAVFEILPGGGVKMASAAPRRLGR